MPDPPLPTTTVVVPTAGRLARSPGMLEPLLADPACTELLVVLDGPQPDTRRALERRAAADARLRLVERERGGAGGGAARHTASQMAAGELLVFVDDDVLAAPGLVSGHARHHAAARRLVVVGYMPVAMPRRGRRPVYPEALYAEAYEWMCGLYEQDAAQLLLNFWAGNHSLRREDSARCGAPDARLGPLYHADRHLGLRMRELGLRARFDRSLRAQHLYRRSVSAFVTDCRRQGRGRLLIHELHRDVLGQLPEHAYEEGLPPRSRRVVAGARRLPWVAGPAAAALRAGARTAALAGRRPDELRLGRALRSLEQQRGMLAAARPS